MLSYWARTLGLGLNGGLEPSIVERAGQCGPAEHGNSRSAAPASVTSPRSRLFQFTLHQSPTHPDLPSNYFSLFYWLQAVIHLILTCSCVLLVQAGSVHPPSVQWASAELSGGVVALHASLVEACASSYQPHLGVRAWPLEPDSLDLDPASGLLLWPWTSYLTIWHSAFLSIEQGCETLDPHGVWGVSEFIRW